MDKVVQKRPLREESGAPPIRDPELALRTFEEILKRGWSLYPDHGTSKGFPRIYRIVALSES